MSARRLFGVETEYAVTAFDRTGSVLPSGALSSWLLQSAAATLPHLPGSVESGLFLGNGSRLYVDAGDHPEIAGPECLDPWDAVRYARAGDVLMLRLVDSICGPDRAIGACRLFTGNVDYSGTGATWGSHESYCHRADPDVLRQRMLPYLISRVIFCGAGGFNPLSPGLEFTLSPRAHHLNHPVSDESTRDRGITHTRDEPLSAGGYQRQHLICGESLRSDLGSWLKVATTALVVALIEGGVDCGDEVELRAPMEALRAFAGDPSCTRRVRTTARGPMTAIEIQRRYVDHARAHAHAAFMPEWTEAVCERWEDILVRLARGPDAVSRSLDWAIKLAMYRDRASRHGFQWEQLRSWSNVVDQLEQTRRTATTAPPPLSSAILQSDTGVLRAAVETLTPLVEAHGLQWQQLDRFLALRTELLEADTRWGQLGPEGLFHILDESGVLDHRVPGVDRFDEAIEDAPAGGRAAIRGRVIQREWARRGECACAWDYVCDFATSRTLDLSDPFAEVEQWSDHPDVASPALPNRGPDERLSHQQSLWEGLGRVLSRARRTASRRGTG